MNKTKVFFLTPILIAGVILLYFIACVAIKYPIEFVIGVFILWVIFGLAYFIATPIQEIRNIELYRKLLQKKPDDNKENG